MKLDVENTTQATFLLTDEASTARFGQALANHIGFPGVITMQGQLGAGKTTLVRAILRGLGYSGLVKSPTYTLVEEYQLDVGSLLHFDLYRLGDPEELEFMGMRDYLGTGSLVVIEWSEKGRGMLPVPDLDIRFEILDIERKVSVDAHSESGKAIIAGVMQEFRSLE